ncbi:nitrate/nitrite transporter [Halobium salinum]|uniref:Nitrate/nitrite transporter n=1 Tax=Halobium salinum TaxID=1364940 RepID=A0ABD5P9C8_9EURY|nr:MFS transporter [Halobium salinum]
MTGADQGGSGESDPARGAGRADRGWLVVAGLFTLSAAAAAFEIAPASVTPLLMDGMSVGPTAAGWLVSVMYATAVVASVPVGVGLDRTDARLAVGAAALALLVAGAWSYVAATGDAYASLVAARVVGGLSYVTLWNAGATLSGVVVDADRRATAVGIFTASAPLGFALGQFGGPLVAEVAGWAATFPAFAALGAVGFALFAAGGPPRQAGVGDPPDRAALGRVLANRAVWTVSLLGTLAYGLYLFLNSWMPTYLTETTALTLGQSGALVAVFPAVGLVARSGSGVLSDRAFGGRRRPVVLGAYLLVLSATAGFLVVEGVPALFACLLLAGFGVQLAIGLVFTYVRELVDPSVAGTAVSLVTAVALAGAFAAPLLAGAAVERTGSFRLAFVGALVLAVAGVGLATVAPEPRESA